MSKVRILIVEDESIVAMDIERRLGSLGYQVVGHVLSGEDAVLRSEEERPDLVLMDIHLKGPMDGIEAAQKIRRLYDIPVIYITAYSDEATLERAKVTEPFGYILKPFQEREIHSAIEMAIYKHRAEQELREAKEAAIEGYRARSEFLANISHELRTPLNSILGMAQLAMDTEEKQERNEYLRMVKDSGSHLLSLITSILDFSKMEAGKLELVEKPFQLDEEIESLLFQIWEQESSEDLNIYLDIDEKSSLSLRGDVTRLRQVLQNLVHNAIKFTSSGYIEIKAWTEDVEKVGKTLLRGSVSDTGIGIPKTEKEEIFSMFYKLDNSLTGVHGGTGLGLAIVKSLIELMGGDIELSSSEGEGSTFSFTIPMKVDRDDMSKPLSLPAGTRVHLVCDDRRRADIRGRQLEAWGAEVVLSDPESVEGSTGDIWCIMSSCLFGRMVGERLVEQGVEEGRILVIGPRRSVECSKLGKDVSVLVEPVARKKLHRAIESAAKKAKENAAGKGGRVAVSLPSSAEKAAAQEKSKKGSDSGDSLERSEGLVSDMLSSFVGTAEELLEAENNEELEETALQIKQELERYGYGETKEKLFKLVLAARKKKTAQVKKILEDLKATGDSLTMNE